MSSNRHWMYRRLDDSGLNPEFIQGVANFIDFAKKHRDYKNSRQIRCPCAICKNEKYNDIESVTLHLYRKGFIDNYFESVDHKEYYGDVLTSPPPIVNANPYRDMVIDALGDTMGYDASNDWDERFEEDPNPEAQNLFQLLRAAEEPLYEGCNMSSLEVASRIVSLKCQYNLAHRCVDDVASLVRDIIPEKNLMSSTFYDIKKLLKGLELPHEKIHACPEGHMLFWKEHSLLDKCLKCGADRYEKHCKGKPIPVKVLIYFPITPRLQRIYATKDIAEKMRWHAENPRVKGTMAHPSDGVAWKHFDTVYQEFSKEPRNVRLGMCTDGFSAFGKFGGKHSCWPVILTPYNLPPELCMKKPFMFLSLLIPGPKNPKGNLDVYMQPLIEELKDLWENGRVTYDVSMKHNFQLKACVLWTISDFPAYGMLSGYTTAGKLACPYCMKHTRSFYLQEGRKISWFDCHRQFLHHDHPFRMSKTAFTKNRVETNNPPPRMSGCEVWELVSSLPKVNDPNYNLDDLKKAKTGWHKQSILWELPYWRHLLIRHNLDVMHTEKNFFEQLIHTVMDVKGRTADSISSRRDLLTYCKRHNLELQEDGNGGIQMPRASFALDKPRKKILCEWILRLKFPDGYASNLRRCVNLYDFSLSGMKSHDCHVFMERLIPVAFKYLLPLNVWKVITELSQFFRDLCASTITEADMMRLERNIPEILCKLEKIFPPSFFNSMEHLPVHLPYEARVGGSVQYRWMYPFERFLDHLKKKIGNTARVEGSICNAYLAEEISNFCTHYFDKKVDTKFKDLGRNVCAMEDVRNESLPGIFHHTYGRASTNGKNRYLDDKEYDRAHLYVLSNCGSLEEYKRSFEEYIMQEYPGLSYEHIWACYEEKFPKWFSTHVTENGTRDDIIRALAMGPSREVKTFSRYYINGFNFHTYEYGKNKSTMNYGVSITDHEASEYFGILEDVIELCYCGHEDVYRVILFKCNWMDTINGMNVHADYKLIEVKHKMKYPKYDPFILAHQALQVYYSSYPSLKRDRQQWWVVFKTKARSVIDAPVDLTFFQEEFVENPPLLSDPTGEDGQIEVNDDDVEGDDVEGDDVETFDEEDVEFEDDDDMEDASESEEEEFEDGSENDGSGSEEEGFDI